MKVRQQQEAQLTREKLPPTLPIERMPGAQKAITKGSAEHKELKDKLTSRTITREEMARLEWNRRMALKRDRGVFHFWSLERERARKGEPSRNWSPEQIQALGRGEKPKQPGSKKSMIGHHKHGVAEYPHVAGTGHNIHAVTDNEHSQRWHGGDTQIPVHGEPRNPDVPEEF